MPAPPCGNYGDVWLDGDVNSTDAMAVAQYLADTRTLTPDQLIRANVKGYGEVSQVDVDLIAEYAAGITDTFPVCGIAEMETRTVSLTEGNHIIKLSFAGYDPFEAEINVSSTGVSCLSVAYGGACGGSSMPRLDNTDTWKVTAHLKEGAGATPRCTWIATQDTSMVVFISEMVLAYNDLADIGFTPSAAEIGDAVLMYSNLGTPSTLWGC